MKVSKRSLLWLVILLILVLVPVLLLRRSHANGANVTSPAQVVYAFVKESGGTTPARGSKVLLGFDPSGEAFLYAFKPGERAAYHGKWSYSAGKLSLDFGTSDFSANATFPLRLGDDRVTMPFQVFAGKPGESQWVRSYLSPEGGIFAAYYAALADKSLALSQQDAVQRAYAYARARIDLDKSSAAAHVPWVRQALRASFVPWAMALFADPGASRADCSATEEPVAITHIGPDDILLTYSCGFTVEVSLQPPRLEPDWQAPLAAAPLAGDPRIHIYPQSPSDASADPPQKTALVIAPFVNHDAQGNANALDSLTDYSDYFDGAATAGPDPLKFSIVPALKQDGYSDPVTLINTQATVEHIAKAIIANPNPGILLFDTHGDSVGFLRTYDNWVDSPRTKWTGFLSLLEDLRDRGLADLVDYQRPVEVVDSNKWIPVTLQVAVLAVYNDPTNLVDVAALKPKFWDWAEKKRQANFHRSLVYINACSTDHTDYLRSMIQAGAYFAWKEDVDAHLGAAVNRYLVASLSRPTHSAEESFYNLMRIARSRQMIYVEDKLLDKAVGSAEYDLNNLNAYGWFDSSMLDYREAGWYGTEKKSGADTFNGGQVWWLLFVERWSTNRDDGTTKIDNCWKLFWSHGDMGGLRSPQCQNYNNGSLPKQQEIVYAAYLSNGTSGSGFNGVTPIPRWTLNDGRAAQ